MSDGSPFITMGASPRAEETPATTSPAAAFASGQQGEAKGRPSGERGENPMPPAAARAVHQHSSPNKDGSVPPKFMNRFSSWKKNNLSVLSTHATELLQQTSPAVKNLVERRNQAFRNMDSTTSAAGSSVPPSVVEEDGTDDANEDFSSESSSPLSSSDEAEDKVAAAVPDTPVSEVPGSAAAAVIAETAATIWNENVIPQGFRGRYSQNNDVPSEKQNKPSQTTRPRLRFLSPGTNVSANNKAATAGPPGTQSQMALILKSSAASHMENILETLETGQFVMLLGSGMLGVNLKQSFLKTTGVYIDFMVRAGAAHNSKVVSVGDALLKVGGTDVSRGTINDVPQTIASTKRPCILVFSKAGHVSNDDDLGPVDIAVAWTHKLISDNSTLNKTGISTMPLTHKDTDSSKSLMDGALDDDDDDEDDDDDDSEEAFVFSDEEIEETKANDKDAGDALSVGSDDDKSKASGRSSTGGGSVGSKKSKRVKAASFHRQNSHALTPEAPSQEVKASLAAYASKRYVKYSL
eukprot:scaffold226276_cov55-Attheya_sp.AAC.5